MKMKIYNKCPIFIQNILTSLQGIIIKRQRYNNIYIKELDRLKNINYSDEKEQKQYQRDEFLKLLYYAYDNSLFYKKFYKDIDISTIIDVSDINKLPILKKEIVRKNITEMYIEDGKMINSSTSGTTGTPMKFKFRDKDIQKRMAYLDFFKYSNGFENMKMRRASFTTSKIIPEDQVKKIFWRDNLSIKQRLYSGYHCNEKNAEYYIQNLNKYKPKGIDGLPSSIYELAKFINKNNVELKFSPVAIFPTAETLLPHYRKEIEKAFDCPVRDQYASSEGAPFITTCNNGNLHYNLDTGIIEVEESGNILVTSFTTYGTPLIRYEIGDKVFFSTKDKCNCGSCHPIVDRIEGRSQDYLWSPENGKITAIYLSLVSEEFKDGIKKMKFIQKEENEIVVILEIDKTYKQSMNDIIIDKLKYSFGNKMSIKIEIVDKIEKDISGKFRFIENRFKGAI